MKRNSVRESTITNLIRAFSRKSFKIEHDCWLHGDPIIIGANNKLIPVCEDGEICLYVNDILVFVLSESDVVKVKKDSMSFIIYSESLKKPIEYKLARTKEVENNFEKNKFCHTLPLDCLANPTDIFTYHFNDYTEDEINSLLYNDKYNLNQMGVYHAEERTDRGVRMCIGYSDYFTCVMYNGHN